MNIHDFGRMKSEHKRISMVTCYDYTSAKIIAATNVDVVLVGDSLAMVMHGHPTTLPATTEIMALHTAAVARGASNKFIVTDIPFPKHREGIPSAMTCVDALMKSGANAVKVEGIDGHDDVIRHMIGSGVPVMGHLGLTPQSVNRFGGYKVQGKDNGARQQLIDQALKIEDAGCFSLVLEAIPTTLAREITERLHIPTIGIGAGPHVDGQVLVLHDLLGLTRELKPKFVRHFLSGAELFAKALDEFDNEVKSGLFPTEKESYQ